MNRYPFRSVVNKYLKEYDGVYAATTHKELHRRFRRIERILQDLKASGLVSSMDPSKLSPEDVKNFAVYLRRECRISPGALQHDIGTLGMLCMYSGNDCVRFARVKYPSAFPAYRKVRGSVLSRDEFDLIIRYAGTCSGDDLRNAACVCFALGTGARTSEIRSALVEDLDLVNGTLYIREPKGVNSYGIKRIVPVRPEVRGILSLFILPAGMDPKDPIFGISGAPVSLNSLGQWRSKVSEACGIQFDFRMLRRTYGQYLLDEGWSLTDVSVLLGHTNVSTTNTFYAGARPSRVVQSVLSGWDSNGGNKGEDSDARRLGYGESIMVQGKGFEPSNSYENRP